ncbi:MAG: exodeoxyribonuclease subunit beta [Pseudomonadota bacterium]
MPMQPLNALTLPLQGIQLIEASAGTGKTWTIAALYVRLIIGHGDAALAFNHALLPQDILVVTFTEAATAELRDRIRRRLTEAADCFRDAAQPDPFMQQLLDAYPESSVRLAHAHRLAVAADSMDDAAIFTIHGWCSRMLKQHAFDSGAPFILNIEGEEKELLNECVRDFWRSVFYPLETEACRLVMEITPSPDALQKQIGSLIRETPDALAQLSANGAAAVNDVSGIQAAIENHLAYMEQLAQLELHARNLWQKHQDEIEGILQIARQSGHLNGNSYRNFDNRLQAFRNWATQGITIENDWFKRFSTGGFKLNAAANGIEPEHSAFRAIADWLEAGEQNNTAEAFHNAILSGAAFWITDRFAKEKNRLARLDYNDLIHKLDLALQNGAAGERLAQIIRTQFPVAMIDEFQDTDPAQYRIFETIYGSDAALDTAWLMIGDPKQAIYGFRGADIFTYLKARQRSGVGHHTLATNHRSTRPLVAAVNQLFEFADGHAAGAFLFRPDNDADNPMAYQPVNAKGRDEVLIIEGEEATALNLWHYANDHAAIGITSYRAKMAAVCANEIARLLTLGQKGQAYFAHKDATQQPLKEADIAILVRDGTEAGAIRAALFRRGLRSVYMSDRDSVYDSQEARDLLVWLRAMLSPQDGRLLRAVLATHTLGFAYTEIEHLSTDEIALDRLISQFTHYGALWNGKGVLPAVRQLIIDHQIPARLMQRPDGERALTNLLHLAELLQTEGVQRDGEQGLLRFFEETLQLDGQAAEDSVIRLESDAALIKVITIHKSKGLEYPLVFLPFICSYKETNTTRSSYFKYHNERQALSLEMVKLASDQAIKLMDRERLQEELRLFYVAVTRARHACWLGIAPIKTGNGNACQIHKGAMGYILDGGAEISADALRHHLEQLQNGHADIRIIDAVDTDEVRYQATTASTTLAQALDFKGTFENWWIASYSALKLVEDKHAAQDEQAAPVHVEVLSADTSRDDQHQEEADSPDDNLPPQSGQQAAAVAMHAFPAGPEHGVFLHDWLERAALKGFDVLASDATQRENLLQGMLKNGRYQDFQDTLRHWLEQFISTPFKTPAATLTLSALAARDCVTEMEFWIESHQVNVTRMDRLISQAILPGAERPALGYNLLNGMLKGFIDLLFRHDGKYYVVDYKSNRLGKTDAEYTEANLNAAILKKRYDVQYVLYVLALHRYLKSRLGDGYDYETHIGGVVYFFLRGLKGPTQGAHYNRPAKALIEQLDALFQGHKEIADAH